MVTCRCSETQCRLCLGRIKLQKNKRTIQVRLCVAVRCAWTACRLVFGRGGGSIWQQLHHGNQNRCLAC